MASDITPGNIDGTYPIAGIDNDSQGFRTNFTNTSTNFAEAKSEIEDLQAKVVLKAPLDGESVTDNDMLGETFQSATLIDTRETIFDHGALAGAVVIDHQNGQYQTVETSGDISLSFTNFPGTAGTPVLGRVRLAIDVMAPGDTVTLPSTVTNGLDFLDGKLFTLSATAQDEGSYDGTGTNGTFIGGDGVGVLTYVAADVLTMSDGSTITVDTVDGNDDVLTFDVTTSGGATVPEGETIVQVSNAGSGTDTTFSITPGTANFVNAAIPGSYEISFAAIGVYEFEFTNYDNTSDITVADITRSNVRGPNPAITNTPPATSVGLDGDKSGDLAYDGAYFYFCVTDWDGTLDIWRRVDIESSSW